MLNNHILLFISALCYVVFCVGLFNLGAKSHRVAAEGGDPIGQFPNAYFTMLAISLIPMAVAGLVFSELYIMATRIPTLCMVLVVYGMVQSTHSHGMFTTGYYRRWAFFWCCVMILGPMAWVVFPSVRAFAHDWQSVLVYGVIVIMLIYAASGQLSLAKQLFRYHLSGHYSVRRLSLQFIRLIGFVTQAVHYFYLPSSAPSTFFGLDPFSVQGAIGAGGTIMVLMMALFGLMSGRKARRVENSELVL